MERSFLKQYGERRTGTNYLRYLVSANFAGTVVLMHILGDKHSPPAPFDDLWRASREAVDPALAFVSAATHAAPAESTIPGDADQQSEVERLAHPVANAFDTGDLGFVISIKDPYAWALSYARYKGWHRHGRRIDARALTAACMDFNRRYAAWLALERASPLRVQCVRYEDLLADAAGVLSLLQRKFALQRSAPEVVGAAGRMPAAIWDHDSDQPGGDAFAKRDFYLQREYLALLVAADLQVITGSIDWSLLANFGYAPIAISSASSIAAACTSPLDDARATASGDESSAHDSTASP